MRTPTKIITALALAGIAIAGGSVFTATGIGLNGQPATAQAFGGTVGQTVSAGVTVDNIHYTYGTDGTTATSVDFTLSAKPAGAPGSVSATILSGVTPATSTFTTAGGTPTLVASNNDKTYTAALTSGVGVDITHFDVIVAPDNPGTGT